MAKDILVMVVDDSRTIRSLFCEAFTQTEFSIIEAASGEQALELSFR